MKIYLDLEIFLNFSYDLILLMCTDTVLIRHTKFYRLILSALLGAISILILFLPFNKILLFTLKILTSIFMLLIAFGFKNIKYFATNILYLYMESIILGGFLYLLDTQLSYDHKGLVFFFNGLSINYLLLIIISPIILYLYIIEHKKYKSTIKYNYQVQIVFKNGKTLICNGMLDTGNKLKDPITKKYVILVSRKKLIPYINIRSPMYVPYKSLNISGLVECFQISYLKINNKIYKNYLVGIENNNFQINGTDCLLNSKLLEDI